MKKAQNHMDMIGRIEHTILNPHISVPDFIKQIREARRYAFANITIFPGMAAQARELIHSPICCVIGFPCGNMSTRAKLSEVNSLLESTSIEELDIVAPTHHLKNGDTDRYEKELRDILFGIPRHIVTKIIIETPVLTVDEIETASKIVQSVGAEYVKTATGMYGPTLPSHLESIRHSGTSCKIKASGGIKTAADVRLMLYAGADRIGTSNGIEIAKEVYLEHQTARKT